MRATPAGSRSAEPLLSPEEQQGFSAVAALPRQAA